MYQAERWDPLELRWRGQRYQPQTVVRQARVEAIDLVERTISWRLLGNPHVNGEHHLSALGHMVLDRGLEPEATRTYVDIRISIGDIVDFAVHDEDISALWLHVYYAHAERRSAYAQDLRMQKSDALFAARTSPGRRAEHHISESVLRPAGHVTQALHRPEKDGTFRFVIDYAVTDRRHETSDLQCELCHRVFEVKTRLRDRHRRVSHSRSRPFETENRPNNYHVFFYRHWHKYEVLSNRDIDAFIRDRQVSYGHAEVDAWADVGDLGGRKPPALELSDYRCAAHDE